MEKKKLPSYSLMKKLMCSSVGSACQTRSPLSYRSINSHLIDYFFIIIHNLHA